MKVAIKFPRWVVEVSEDELPDFLPYRRKLLRMMLRTSPYVKPALCYFLDILDALLKQE